MKKQKIPVKHILLGVGTLAVIGLGYFLTRPKDNNLEPDEFPDTAQIPTLPTTGSSSGKSSPFPLKKWSKGKHVKRLQQYLNKKHNAGLTEDGVLGPNTIKALTNAGLPTEISEREFNRLTTASNGKPKTSSANSFNPKKLAQSMHHAIGNHLFSKALRLLSYIHTTNGYSSVNRYFKQSRTSSGVRKTLVTALLGKFKSDWATKKLTAHFYRIGLKFNGSKWSLNGFDFTNQIKTIRSTKVWNKKGETLIVPVHTILGEFISARNGITSFRTLDGKTLFTNTQLISYV